MKKLFTFFLTLVVIHAYAQQKNVGIGTITPNASAILELQSSDKGVLVPRVADTNLISSPAVGLLVYLTSNNFFYYYDGTSWKQLGNASVGPTGVTGPQGPQGIQGGTGSTGTDGPTGSQGLQGVQGNTGLDGSTGPQGPQGFQGATGADGPTGDQGLPGNTGVTGADGATGVQGLQGNTGATGADGTTGITGATGIDGGTGAQGIQGITGPTGSDGATGIQGVQGITGPSGADGATGLQGNTGTTGLVGATGDPGATGVQGVPGITGPSGADGAMGLQGNTGATGLVGETGVQGSTGATGATGVTGTDGALSAWSLTGNSGTTPGTNFIGTTDAKDFAVFTSGTEKMRVLSGGNVGIGTTTPTTKLFVSTTDDFVAWFKSANYPILAMQGKYTGRVGGSINWNDVTGSPFWRIGSEISVGGSPNFEIFDANNNAARIFITSGGNVGIGNTNPLQNFHVTGTARISSLASGGSGAILTSNSSGDISATNFSGNSNQVLLGNNTFGNVPTNTAWSLTGNSGTTVGTNFIGTTDGQDFAIYSNNAERMRFPSGGNVGIGTTSPSAKLQVVEGTANTIALSVKEAANSDELFMVPNLGAGGYNSLSKAGDIGLFFRDDNVIEGGSLVIGQWSASPKGLRIDNTGNIGIGSNSPLGKLDVVGPIRQSATNPTTILFHNTNESGTPTGTDGFRIRYDDTFFGGTNDALIFEKTDGNDADPDAGGSGIAFVNTGNDGVESTAMAIKGDGNVGIGITTPSKTFHLVGSARVSSLASGGSGAIVSTNSSGDLAATNFSGSATDVLLGNGTFGAAPGSLPSGTTGQTLRHNGTSWVASSTLFNDGTNIGVGSTSPLYKLDVAGEGKFTSADIINYYTKNENSVFLGQRNGEGGAICFTSSTAGTHWFVQNILGVGLRVLGNSASASYNFTTTSFRPGNGLSHDLGSSGGVATDRWQNIYVNVKGYQAGGGSWSAVSDRRLKKDIKPYFDGLDKLLQINPVFYKYNEKTGYDTTKEFVGVIAQELKEVTPYMVNNYNLDGENFYSVDNSSMTYMLINSIKEMNSTDKILSKKINDQQLIIETLQKQNEFLKESFSQQQEEIKNIKKQVGLRLGAEK